MIYTCFTFWIKSYHYWKVPMSTPLEMFFDVIPDSMPVRQLLDLA